MTRMVRCRKCDRMHAAALTCVICRTRSRIANRLAERVGHAVYERLAYLMNAAPDTPEGIELNALADIISAVEARETQA